MAGHFSILQMSADVMTFHEHQRPRANGSALQKCLILQGFVLGGPGDVRGIFELLP
jgi:hypothetical protein